MTICDVCKKNPVAVRLSAELRIGPKSQRKSADLCKGCHEANTEAIDAAAKAFTTALDTLKPAAE